MTAKLVKMVPSEKRTWLKALRSGVFKQAHAGLRKINWGNSLITEGYCCLGVAKKSISGVEPRKNSLYLRPGTFRLTKPVQLALANANDVTPHAYFNDSFKRLGVKPPIRDLGTTIRRKYCSFKSIANWVEKNL